ncbi:36008_t:CDS:2, partial [Gigaspora margarita]
NAAQENATQEDENSLELIELTDFSSYFIELLNTHLMQLNDDLENVSPFLVQCAIDIPTYDKSTKKVVKELIELIEDMNEFLWMYVIHVISTPYELIRLRYRKFLGMFIFSFWWLILLVKNMPQNFPNPTPPPMYFIKSTILAAKPKKHEDFTKHCDTPTMERFDCHDTIKITISQSNNTAKLLREGQYKIILEQLQSRALAVITELHDYLLKLNINIRECGIDATYNTNNFGMELYCFQAEVNGTGFPLAHLFLENNRTCGSETPSNKKPRNFSFNSLSELGTRFPFDGVEQSAKFCPKEYRKAIWKMMEKHFHQHPLIPTCDSQFITRRLIQEAAIQE